MNRRDHHARLHLSRLTRRGFLAGSAGLALGAQTARAAQEATPVDDGLLPFVERIGALLAVAPARELTVDAPLAFYYADLARQMGAVGVELADPNTASADLPAGFYEASLALPLASQAFVKGMMPEWFETFGFNPFGVQQAITLNAPPNVMSIFMADFDVASIVTALEASGYEQVQQDAGGGYWTVGDELNLESMVGRLGVGTMNHAVVRDGVLVFAQREPMIQEVTQAAAGLAPSMAEQGIWPSIAALFSHDTVGLIPVSASFVQPQARLTPEGLGTPGPASAAEIDYLAFGVRAGSASKPLSLVGEGTPEATPVSVVSGVPAQVEARIRYGDPASAEREAEAIAQRWRKLDSPFSGESYAELMRLEDSRVHEDDPSVVAVDFTSDIPNRWIQMIQTRDLLPFVPAAG